MPVLLALLATAAADLPPPPGYVETCTLANVQKPGETCGICTATFQDADICAQTLAPQGYAHRCTAGTSPSVWSEIWCKPGEHNVEADFRGQGAHQQRAPMEQKQGCPRSLTALVLLVLSALPWLGRRPPAPPQRGAA